MVKDWMERPWHRWWGFVFVLSFIGLSAYQADPVQGAEGRVYRVHGKVIAVNLSEIPNLIVVNTLLTKKVEMTVGATINHETKVLRGTKRVALHTIKVGEMVWLIYVKQRDGLFAHTIQAR
jgi:hypothetical protein